MTSHLLSSANREFRSLLNTCAEADHLTVFVGAGCSAEVGLPTWKTLIHRYLGIAIELKIQDGAPDADDFADRHRVIGELIDAFGEPSRTAMIGDMLLGDQRRRSTLRLSLYNTVGILEPGPTASAVALLYRERQNAGKITTIVTTNYDDLIELALAKVGYESNTISPRTLHDLPDDLNQDIVDSFSADRGRIVKGEIVPVWHLHGYMPFTGEADTHEPIVFSERDYSLYNSGAVDSIARLFNVGSCLFTGMSLVDFDIATAAFSVAQLRKSDPSASRPLRLSDVDHFAVTFNPMPPRSLAARLGSARLDSMGIHPLNGITTYAQIPQILHELVLRIAIGEDYWQSDRRYGMRLNAWASAHRSKYESAKMVASRHFKEQVKLAKRLGKELELLQELTGISSIGDALGLHIWKREPESHAMSLWISSEYAKRSDRTPGSRGEITHESQFCAVSTAAFGVPSPQFEQLGPRSSSRWKQSLGVPAITSSTSPYGRLLVGVVTLSSNLDQKESELGQMLASDPTLANAIEAQLSEIGERFLEP